MRRAGYNPNNFALDLDEQGRASLWAQGSTRGGRRVGHGRITITRALGIASVALLGRKLGSKHRTSRMMGGAVAIALLLAGGASESAASTVRVSGDRIVFTAAAGESNELTVEEQEAISAEACPTWRLSCLTLDMDPGLLVSDDGARLVAGEGCVAINEHQAACPLRYRAQATLGDGNDAGVLKVAATVYGGPGDDSVTGGNVSIFGEEGNDTLRGSYVAGGAGDDDLRASWAVTGGPGADVLYGSLVDYQDRQAGVAVSLDGVANDGETGENDNVLFAWTIYGGAGSDTLAGSDGKHETLVGLGGDDTLRGGGSDTLVGGDGNDLLIMGPGGYGVLMGGSGSDQLRSRNAERDDDYCGEGPDSVIADTIDYIEPDCERVSVR